MMVGPNSNSNVTIEIISKSKTLKTKGAFN